MRSAIRSFFIVVFESEWSRAAILIGEPHFLLFNGAVNAKGAQT
jgi:hypothetical protein